MSRRRQVHFAYPSAMSELTKLLCTAFGKEEVRAALGLTRTTVYRWAKEIRSANAACARQGLMLNAVSKGQGVVKLAAEAVALAAACEKENFRVMAGVVHLLAALGAPRPISQAAEEFANGDEEAVGPSTPKPVEPQLILEGFEVKRREAHRSKVDGKILLAKHSIEVDFAKEWSCDNLAIAVGMKKFGFIRHFTKVIGFSPYHYLLKVRVQKAQELLRTSGLSLPEVAHAVGFGSRSAMQRAFVNFLGAAPGKTISKLMSSS